MITEISDFNIRAFNTFGMNVECSKWIDYTEPSDLPSVFASVDRHRFRCIGAGSNMLFTGNYDGTLIHSSILSVETEPCDNGMTRLRVGSGMTFDKVIEMSAAAGLWGIENLSAIPGDAGAAAVQNIGAYGVEVKDVIESVEVYDIQENRFRTIDRDECGYGYRMSMFKLPENRYRYVVTAINILLSANAGPKLDYGNIRQALEGKDASVLTPMDVREAIIRIRDEKLPAPELVGSAGSFFKNPVVSREVYDKVCLIAGESVRVPHYEVEAGVKIPAAWLIEQCGFKGKTKGNAAVWHKQPLVIVNANGHATPDEIIGLEQDICRAVDQRYGITLEPEVDHI